MKLTPSTDMDCGWWVRRRSYVRACFLFAAGVTLYVYKCGYI